MTDVSALSDAELRALYDAPAAAPKPLSAMSDDELKAAYGASSSGGGDAVKSLGSGVVKGYTGLAGLPADAVALGARGLEAASNYINDTLGVKRFEARGEIPSWLPTSDRLQKTVEDRVTGELHKPQTRAGRYAETVGEFLPGALGSGGGGLLAKGIKFGVVPGVISESAGQATEGTAAEPYARIAGALIGPTVAGVPRRVVTPFESSPARRDMVQTLNDEGVTSLTAGQRTGNKNLQYAESILGDGPMAGGVPSRIQTEGQEQFTNAALRRAGTDGLATPEVLAANQRRLGDAFQDISSRNTLQFDQQMSNDITNTVGRYGRLLDAQQRAHVGDVAADIIDRLRQGNGTMSGVEYQAIRSDLSTAASSANGNYATALRGLRDSLDDAFRRSVSPADGEALDVARREYRAQKNIENSASGAGEVVAEGNITPARLRNAVATGKNRGAYARGEGDLSGLARAGVGVMSPLPNSGTAQREIIRGIATMLGGGLGGGAAGVPGALAGAAAATAVPAIAGRLLMSRPAQRYLGNQLITGPAAGDARTAAIVNALIAGGR